MNSDAILLPDGKLKQELSIPCYFTDGRFALKPSSFMDMAQEMAYKASDRLGFGYDVLMERNAAWVLSRMRFDFVSVPHWRDRVVMFTWHKGTSGPFYLRDFSLTSPEGSVLVAGTSSWLVIDVKARHIVRDFDVDAIIPAESICSDDAIARNAAKLVCRSSFEPVGVHTVSYSDIDLLGHTNNAMYVRWAADCIGYDRIAERGLKSVEVNFNQETHAGDEVQLGLCESEGAFYVEGSVDGRQSFCTKIVLG